LRDAEQDSAQDVTEAGPAAYEAGLADDEKLDDIFTYSSVGINSVKEDATGENVRADIGGISAGEMRRREP
jgi:membrane protein involved in colicin uptake